MKLALPQDDPNQNSSVASCVAFSPDGAIVATGWGAFLGMLQKPSPGQTILWDARSGKRISTFLALKDGVRSVEFSRDGRTLTVAEYPGIIRLIALPERREIRQLVTDGERGFFSVAFFPDGKRVAAGIAGEPGGAGNDVQIWDVGSGKRVRTLAGHEGPVGSVAVSPDGRLLASGAWDGTARIWDASTGKLLHTLTFKSLIKRLEEGDMPWVDSLAFSRDGRTLATSAGEVDGPGEVDVWDTSTGGLKATLKGLDLFVDHVVFSPDSRLLATSGEGWVKMWDAATFQELGKIKGAGPIAFSPDGKTIVSQVNGRTMVIRKIADAEHR